MLQDLQRKHNIFQTSFHSSNVPTCTEWRNILFFIGSQVLKEETRREERGRGKKRQCCGNRFKAKICNNRGFPLCIISSAEDGLERI